MNNTVFSIGQYVVYGIHGICLIEDIRDLSLSPMLPSQTYYVLKEISKGAVIYVPCVSNPEVSLLRELYTSDDLNAMLDAIRGKCMEWNVNRKERTARFRAILSGGLSSEMILMIRCIRLQKDEYSDTKKKLSGSDSDILHSAENMVNQEFGFVLGISEDKIAEYISGALDTPMGA